MNDTIPSTRSSPDRRRAPLYAGLLLLGAVLPAQRFQYDYGTASIPEIGTSLVKTKFGYGVVDVRNGTDVLGLAAAHDGHELVDMCIAPTLPGRALTPHCLRQTSDGGFIASGEVLGNDAGIEVFLMKLDKYGNNVTTPLFPTYRGHATGIRQGTRVVETTAGYVVLANINPDGNSEGVLFGTNKGLGLTWWRIAFVQPAPHAIPRPVSGRGRIADGGGNAHGPRRAGTAHVHRPVLAGGQPARRADVRRRRGA